MPSLTLKGYKKGCTAMGLVTGSHYQEDGDLGQDGYASAEKTPTNTVNSEEDGMVFHMDGRGAKDDDRNKLLWQGRPACNWDTGFN